MILITSTGELLLYFTVIFFSFHIKKKNSAAGSLLFLCCPVFTFAAGIHSQWIRNLEGRLLKVNLSQELGLNLK